jgi:type VI secretion system secreted protein Hcp
MLTAANPRVRMFLVPLLAALLLLGWIAYSNGERSPSPRPHASAPTKHLTANDLLLAAANAKSGIFLEYDGITGPAGTDHSDHAPVNSFQFGVSNPVISTGGGGSGAGKPSVSEIVITRTFDKYSPQFLHEILTGEHANAAIYFTQLDKTTGAIVDYLEFDLEGAVISADSMSSGGNTPSESMSLNFAKFTMRARFSGSPDQVTSWNIATNTTG